MLNETKNKSNDQKTPEKHIVVTNALPVLNKIMGHKTLAEYFEDAISPLNKTASFWEKDALISEIARNVEKLFGKEKAQGVISQLSQMPIVETGTHLAFLRDYDDISGDDMRSRLNQNILISSAMMKHIGAKYHIGIYGENVSFMHACSGGYYQLGNEILPIARHKTIQNACLFQAPQISEEYFSESILLLVKFKMLDKLLDEKIKQTTDTTQTTDELQIKYLLNSKNKLKSLIGYGEKNKNLLAKYFNQLKEKNKILNLFSFFAEEAKSKLGKTFKDVDKEYETLAKVFENKELNFSDQVALIQADTINKSLNGTGIEHINVANTEVCCNFLIRALENEKSIWYRIFSEPKVFNHFYKTFASIRSSWKEGESPFNVVKRKDNNYFKNIPMPLTAITHDVETIKECLKNRQIAPSSALQILIFQTAGILAHGGFFQTVYSSQIKKELIPFLISIKEIKRAQVVAKMSVDIAFLSLAILKDATGKPMKLSEFQEIKEEKRKRIIENIPQYSAKSAVLNALPTLHQYLDKTAPGYLEAEATRNQTMQSRGDNMSVVKFYRKEKIETKPFLSDSMKSIAFIQKRCGEKQRN